MIDLQVLTCQHKRRNTMSEMNYDVVLNRNAGVTPR